jgi:hypothetical protein
MNNSGSATRVRQRMAAVGFVSAILAVVPGASATAIPPTADAVNLECGSVVTRDVRLSHDLIGCTGNGLVVDADGVDIDLNGHLISGTGPFVSLSGIDIDAHRHVRIHD